MRGASLVPCSALAALLSSATARAACPSYTSSSAFNTHQCAIDAAPGTNPTALEWSGIFLRVARGPSDYGSAGPSIGDIPRGCGNPVTPHDVPFIVPVEILQAIVMEQSGWTQFCVPTSPADQVGSGSQTLISFDCGYGAGQITSDMHLGETAVFDRNRVASDATYNVATLAQILADKWRATACVGDRDPCIIEDWYSAVWALNGLAFVNNPNNPNFDPGRGVWDPATSAASGVPFQERVFGRIAHAPSSPTWTAVDVAYPDRSGIGASTGTPGALPEPACASPTDCVRTRPVHLSASCRAAPDAGARDAGSRDASPRDADTTRADRALEASALDASRTDGTTSVAAGGATSRDASTDAPRADSTTRMAGGAGALLDGSPDARTPPGVAASGSPGGCGCRVEERPASAGLAWLVGLGSAWVAIERRTRRTPRAGLSRSSRSS